MRGDPMTNGLLAEGMPVPGASSTLSIPPQANITQITPEPVAPYAAAAASEDDTMTEQIALQGGAPGNEDAPQRVYSLIPSLPSMASGLVKAATPAVRAAGRRPEQITGQAMRAARNSKLHPSNT